MTLRDSLRGSRPSCFCCLRSDQYLLDRYFEIPKARYPAYASRFLQVCHARVVFLGVSSRTNSHAQLNNGYCDSRLRRFKYHVLTQLFCDEVPGQIKLFLCVRTHDVGVLARSPIGHRKHQLPCLIVGRLFYSFFLYCIAGFPR